MKPIRISCTLFILAIFFCIAPRANAQEFTNVKECTAGRRVADKQGNKGTVVKITQGTLCQVMMDETKRESSYIFWMLHDDNSKAPSTFVSGPSGASNEAFANVNECTIGRRVADKQGNKGTVLRVTQGSLCQVRLDGSGRETSYIFWMLHADTPAANAAAQAAAAAAYRQGSLPVGVYECFAGGQYTFMDMRITGANTYEASGVGGKFRQEAGGKIVFESGSMVKYHGIWKPGPSIGLNTDGGSFYATTCEYNKSKK